MLHLFIKPTGLPGEVFTEEQCAYKSAAVLYTEAGERDNGEKKITFYLYRFILPSWRTQTLLSDSYPVCFSEVHTYFFSLLFHQYRIGMVTNSDLTLKGILKLCPKLIETKN